MLIMGPQAHTGVTVWPSTPVIYVKVDKPSIYGFLAMPVALMLSAILVFIAQHFLISFLLSPTCRC